MISFTQIYKKTQRNLEVAAHEGAGFDWSIHEQTTLEDRRALLADLAAIAKTHGMRMSVCSQHDYLIAGVTEAARCVDAARMDRIARRFGRGETSLARGIKLKGNRAECGCYDRGILANTIPVRMAASTATRCASATLRCGATASTIPQASFCSHRRDMCQR